MKKTITLAFCALFAVGVSAQTKAVSTAKETVKTEVDASKYGGVVTDLQMLTDNGITLNKDQFVKMTGLNEKMISSVSDLQSKFKLTDPTYISKLADLVKLRDLEMSSILDKSQFKMFSDIQEKMKKGEAAVDSKKPAQMMKAPSK